MFLSREGREVQIFINGQKVNTIDALVIQDSGKAIFDRSSSRHHIRNNEWQQINLKKGLNKGHFLVTSLNIHIPFNVFFYDQITRIVLTDIDGTITESDIKGHVLPIFGLSADHDHVVELFDKINENGYQIVYLTARSIAQDMETRKYLFHVMLIRFLEREGNLGFSTL